MLQTVEQLLNIRKPDTFAGSVSTVARYFYVKACKFAGITRHTSVRDSSIKLVAHPGCTILIFSSRSISRSLTRSENWALISAILSSAVILAPILV